MIAYDQIQSDQKVADESVSSGFSVLPSDRGVSCQSITYS
jgi:hypothetical protein